MGRGYISVAAYVPLFSSVCAMAWLGKHRGFVVEEFIKNGGSVISTQRAFRIRFELGRRDSVPDAKTIRLWVSNFTQTGSALKRKPTGRPRTAITPENVARVRTSIQQSPKRSAVKHAAALGLSERSVRRILHKELHLHPYRQVTVSRQSLNTSTVLRLRRMVVARTVLVTGCSRGLGLEMVRQLARGNTPPEVIVATCRNPESAEELQQLCKSHKEVHLLKFDVVDEGSYGTLVKQVEELLGNRGLNLLINNAGVAPKSTRINMVKWKQMVDTFLVNSVAPVMLSKALLPQLKIAASQTEGSNLSVQRAAIINISSTLGSIENNHQGGLYPYRASKSGLNAITKSLSIDLRDSNILVCSVSPGWVQTDMGGKNADLTPAQSISNILHLLTTMNNSHHGQFYDHDGVKVPW